MVLMDTERNEQPPMATWTDPALQTCDIRIVRHCDDTITTPLDFSGTRRAPRFNIIDGVEVQIDGKPVTLIDLSLVGAQVVSPHWLRPGLRVRFTFANDAGRLVRVQSVIASVSMELLEGRPRYRAGIEFVVADEAAIQRFIDAKKKRRP